MKFVGYIFIALVVPIFAGNAQSMAASVVPTDRLTSTALVDTPNFSIPIVINIHGLYSLGLNFGIHPDATSGIDPSLGEVEYPPFGPPGIRYIPFRTSGGNALLDLVPFTSTAQVDTYRIGFSPDSEFYPLTFSWPNLDAYYSGSVRLKSDLSGSLFDIDMKAQHSYTMTTGPVNDPDALPWDWFVTDVYIIAEGPRLVESVPFVETLGWISNEFHAIINASGGTLSKNTSLTGIPTVWFEYGATESYSASTTPQTITEGTRFDYSVSFDTTTIPMDSRIHFRAVYHTSTGPAYYGDDRIISRGSPSSEYTSGDAKYRTATYRDWADAVDKKGKRKSIKPKPDKVMFALGLSSPDSGVSLKVNFSMLANCVVLQDADTLGRWDSVKTITVLSRSRTSEVDVLGFGLSGKLMKADFVWSTTPVIKGNLLSTMFRTNQLCLPMPNLHNVGENIFGGKSQTPAQIVVGANTGAHSVLHKKYSNVLKSFVKEQKSGDLYHDKAARCLDVFDKNKRTIKSQQASLPPDKHNNTLFAEQLTLKLNIAASDSGIFPSAFGDLIYTHSTPFDGETIREIVHNVDSFLTCPANPPNGVSDAAIYDSIVHELNASFSGTMDTTSWSGGKVFCPGVRMLKEVPYLQYNLSAVTATNFSHGPGSYTQQPSVFVLSQNYPNPFNPITTIEFTLTEQSLVTLKVYNLLGQEIKTLLNREDMDYGDQSVEFDATGLPSGVYFYKITAQGIDDGKKEYQAIKKMLLVK